MRQHAVTDLAPTLRRAARSFVPWYMHPVVRVDGVASEYGYVQDHVTDFYGKLMRECSTEHTSYLPRSVRAIHYLQ